MFERKANTSRTIFRYHTTWCTWRTFDPLLCSRRANSDTISSAYMLSVFSGIAEMSDK